MMRRVAQLVLPLAVFGLGLAAGSWFSIQRRAVNFAAGIDQQVKELAHVKGVRLAERRQRVATREDLIVEVMSAVVEKDNLLRAHQLHDLLGGLDVTELGDLFQRTLRLEDHERREEVLIAVLTRWAAIDPAGATAAARPYLDRARRLGFYAYRSLDVAVAQAWAAAMPEAALAEAANAPDAPWAMRLASRALFEGYADDPARQFEALLRLPPGRARDQFTESVLNIQAKKDPAGAETHLDLLHDPAQRSRLQSEILGSLARSDPTAALARLAALGPELTAGMAGTQLVNAVLREAARQDPAAALAVVDGLPEELRSQAIGAALVGWAGKSPIAALDWAVAHGLDVADLKAVSFMGPNGNVGWNSLLMTAFDTDSAKAFEWLRAQPASPGRDTLLRDGIWRGTVDQKLALYAELTPESQASEVWTLVSGMNREDPKRAEAWVAALPAGPKRSAAILSLVSGQAQAAPDRTDIITNAWAPGPDRDAALRGVAGSLASNDPLRAIAIANQVTNVTSREIVLEDIARSWLRRDETAARAWIARAPELSAEQRRVIIRQFQEQ